MSRALSYVEWRAKADRDFSHSRNVLYRLYRFVFRIRPLAVIWIEQYEWDQGKWGKVIRCWRYDANGLAPIDEIGEKDTCNIYSTTPVIRFCADPEDKRMFYSEWHGLRHGHGGELKLQEDGSWKSEGIPWVS